MPYDAVKMKDWQISEAAEKKMPSPEEWREKMGLKKDELMPFGRLGRLDFLKIMKRLESKPDGKYIEVTAITNKGEKHKDIQLEPNDIVYVPQSMF